MMGKSVALGVTAGGKSMAMYRRLLVVDDLVCCCEPFPYRKEAPPGVTKADARSAINSDATMDAANFMVM
jgi:hypothetical protein